jgi:hypothetical protein
MPELARLAQLFGIDIHDHQEGIARALASINVSSTPAQGKRRSDAIRGGYLRCNQS